MIHIAFVEGDGVHLNRRIRLMTPTVAATPGGRHYNEHDDRSRDAPARENPEELFL